MNPRATHFRAGQVFKRPDSFASVKLLRIQKCVARLPRERKQIETTTSTASTKAEEVKQITAVFIKYN